jgi:hypothetical protein
MGNSSAAVGAVTFGSTAAGCGVTGESKVFPPGSPIYTAVTLKRVVGPGDVLSVQVLRDGTVISQTNGSITSAGQCTTDQLTTGQLAPGTYRVTYSVGSDILAEGSFSIVVDASASPPA